ncbi:CHAT domain-containing protein [soil metagenome]
MHRIGCSNRFRVRTYLLFGFLFAAGILPAQDFPIATQTDNAVISGIPNIDSDEDQPTWKIKYDSAQRLWKTDINASIALLKSAEKIAFNDLGIYDENYLAILNELGVAYSEINDFNESLEYLRKTIKIQSDVLSSNDERILKTKCNLATTLLKSGEDIEAKRLYLNILNQSANAKVGFTYGTAAENLSKLYEAHEQYDSALSILNNALAINFIDPEFHSRDELILAKGRILRKSHQYGEASSALSSLEKGLLEGEPSSITLLNSLKVEQSLLNIELRLFVKAEVDLLQLYREIKSTSKPDPNLLAELTGGLGYIYEKLGIYDKALVYYRESLNGCIKSYGYNSISCVIMQNNIAGVYLKQGMIREAIIEYEAFAKTFKSVSQEDNNIYLTAINNLATAYRQNGQYQLALESLEHVYAILKKKSQLQDDIAASVMNNMAVNYTLQGNLTKATDYFERVLVIKESLYGTQSPALLDVVGNLAVTYWVLDRRTEALLLFKRSLNLSMKEVKYVFPSLTAQEQVQFYHQQKQNFERFNTLAIQSGNIQPDLLVHMFNNQLLLKSLIFFTNKKRSSLLESKNNKYLSSLADMVDARRAQLSQFYQMPASQVARLGYSPAKLENQIDSIEKIIRHGMHEESQTATTYTWADIQRSLKEDEALVEIVRFRKYDSFSNKGSLDFKTLSVGFTDSVEYAALLTTKETKEFPEFVLLRNGNQLEKRYAAYYRNTIRFDIIDTISYSQYVKPFFSRISDKKKIYISADGIYHQLNLNAILDHDGKFLIEKYDVHSIMNASQLVERTLTEKIDFSKMTLFGNVFFGPPQAGSELEGDLLRDTYEPLPASLEEIQEISNVFRMPAIKEHTFLGKAASESNFRNKINSPSILHIATHGFFSESVVYLNEHAKDDYMFHSGIILASGVQGISNAANSFDSDGIITAYDVMNMDLSSTSLVVISACETGLGRIENSEGVYGLQRSFLQAGAEDVVVSLWKVEDVMTKNLMVRFYTYMAKQHTSREALKLAQLDLLREYRSPRNWAAFVMLSDN